MTFAVGSLVRARGREWVVLPGSGDDLLVLRPLGGTEEEITGIYRPLESVESARFSLPDPEQLGDYRSGRLLRDAVRLGFRSSAGPFRSFGSIAVEPRPYQLVPLLMALKLDPVRLLIADDVGIGKTIEAALIARELLDRGEVTRMAVLCPPHLTEQWQAELAEKFHIDAEQVLPSTVTRLERALRRRASPSSTTTRPRDRLHRLRQVRPPPRRFPAPCPDLVIVDEAHTCVSAGESRGSRHQRFQLVTGLANKRRAAPDPGHRHPAQRQGGGLPPAARPARSRLRQPARRPLGRAEPRRARAARRAYGAAPARQHHPLPGAPTPCSPTGWNARRPTCSCRPTASCSTRRCSMRASGSPTCWAADHRQRLRWWSVLALLRSLASSPAAAAATLEARSDNAANAEEAELDLESIEVLPQSMLDPVDDTSAEGLDVVPSTDLGPESRSDATHRRRLTAMASKAKALMGEHDAKLLKAAKIVNGLLKDGYHPILFCRFIPTAEYVARELATRVPKGVVVEAVTSTLPASEREQRVAELGAAKQPGAGLHRLPLRGDQPAGAFRCRDPL